MKETLYLSGSLTPTPTHPSFEENKQRFVDKGLELSKDYAVFLPAENNGAMGVRGGWTWEDFMRADIPYVLTCNVIYMLTDWQDSRGARLEHWLAKRNHKKIIYENQNQNIDETAA